MTWEARLVPELSIEHVDDEIVDAGNGIHIPRAWIAVVTGLPDIPGPVRAHVVYDLTLRRAVAGAIRVDRQGPGDEVTTTLLRDLRVQYIVQWAAMRVVRIQGEADATENYSQYITRVRAEGSRSSEQTLIEAAKLYRLASVTNQGPLKLVSDELGVSVSTATRMMNRIRGTGLLDEATDREIYLLAREEQMREAEASAPWIQPGTSGPSLGR